jgi:hypothetical protein
MNLKSPQKIVTDLRILFTLQQLHILFIKITNVVFKRYNAEYFQWLLTLIKNYLAFCSMLINETV